jgi:hypothetical protein
MIRRWPLAWRVSLRLAGWPPVAGCALAVTFGLALSAAPWRTEGARSRAFRVVETIVPLVVGLQGAYLLSPEDESPLEVLLACPRPIGWALFERLTVLLTLQGSVALIGSLAGWALVEAEPMSITAMRWIAPSMALCGVALFTTQLTRQGVFGALLATVLWGGMFFGGDAMVGRWPFLWPAHLYLQPGDVTPIVYTFNRAALILGGMGTTALAAYLTRDEERMLGVRRVKGARR